LNERIPLSAPVFGENERRYLQQCIDERWVSSKGRFVNEFEALFAQLHGTEAAVSAVSGTAALHLALLAAGVGPGDEVIVPALTFVATVNPVLYAGAKPVFADVDPVTYGMAANAVEAAVTPRTKAILVVHLYGHPVDMTRISAIAERHGLKVIEDATEALGATWEGKPAGTLGDVAAFSFNGNKIITTGGGGMLLAREPETLERMRHLSLQGRVPGTLEYEHDSLGYNYTLSNVSAAVGLAQLERLEQLVAHRRHLADRYRTAFEGTDLTFCAEVAPARSNHWLMSVLVEDKDATISRLSQAGIDSRPFFVPMPALPHLAPYATGPVPVAERLHRHGVSIPSSADLDDAAQDRVIAALLG
jgi:perosamine synthetase